MFPSGPLHLALSMPVFDIDEDMQAHKCFVLLISSFNLVFIRGNGPYTPQLACPVGGGKPHTISAGMLEAMKNDNLAGKLC
jgi:hypothetical protein